MIQDVDRESTKDIKTERDDPSWAGQESNFSFLCLTLI